MNEKSVEWIKRIIKIVLGCFFIAIGINLFITPHQLLSGGISGIALLLYYVTKLPVGLWVIALNIPVFIIGLRKVNLEFTLISLFSMLLFSALLMVTTPLQQFIKVDDLLASCVLGGMFSGLGSGMIFRQRASLGGSDIVSIVLKQKYEIGISTLMFGINLFVVAMGSIFNSLTLSVYTLISMYISSSVVNLMLNGLDRKKMMIIVSEKGEECAKALLGSMRRGITVLDGYGAYTQKNKKVLYCTVSSRQLSSVKKILIECDPGAFISIIDVSEVQGRGFKKPVF